MKMKLPKKLTKYHLRIIFGGIHIILGLIYIGLQIIVEISSWTFHTQNTAEDFLKPGFVLGAMELFYGILTISLFFQKSFNYPLRLMEAIVAAGALMSIILYIAIRFRWYAHDPDFTDNFTDCYNAPLWPEYYMWNRPPHCSAYFIKRVIMWVMMGGVFGDLVLDFAQLILLRILWLKDSF
ncbi:uncharacterized protein LOC129596897 [Paramacrobiotus metropolitanus]|uniref:uncharacterized protein LOC129596897 n=1 Tax=Paramacrobiotus metropolitanus TaxID=2943436 RepID=UPI002445FBEA|nr:uncharacterized protein LOC129596897 [Paramacrobiotus metropolitanus]